METLNYLIESIPPRFLEREKIVPVASITAATVLLLSSYMCLSRKGEGKNSQGIKEIPVPGSPYFYFGHMFSLGNSPGKVLAKWHREFGPILKLQMGIKTWIMVDDPVLAHKIFVSNGAVSSGRPHVTFAHEYYGFKGK